MVDDAVRLVWGVVREGALAVLYWVLGLTGVFLAAQAFIAPLVGRGVRPRTIYDTLPIEDGSVVSEWTGWLVGYSTFQFGWSFSENAPVTDVLFAEMGTTLVFLAVAAAVALGLALPGVALVAWLDDHPAGVAAALPAYPLGTIGPLVGAIATVGLLFAADQPYRLVARGGGIQTTALLAAAVVVALPVAADLVRKVHRERAATDGTGGVTGVLGLGRGGPGLVEGWYYLTYLVGATVVVESVFVSEGLGRLFVSALEQQDVALLAGVATVVLMALVAATFLRNVARLVTDIGRERFLGTPTPPAPEVEHVTSALTGQYRLLGGLGWLALLGLVGLVGAALVGIPAGVFRAPPSFEPFPPMTDPAVTLHTLASLVVVALTATAVATVAGALPGLLAAVLEGRFGTPGGALATAIRTPGDYLMLPPAIGVVALWAFTQQPTDRLGAELLVGATGGLVLAGFLLRATYEAGRHRFDADRSMDGPALVALVGGYARVDTVLAGLVFVAGTVTFLGFLPRGGGTLVAFQGLDVGFNAWSLAIGKPGTLFRMLAWAYLPTAAVVGGVLLVGDGLGQAAAALRQPEVEKPFAAKPTGGRETAAEDDDDEGPPAPAERRGVDVGSGDPEPVADDGSDAPADHPAAGADGDPLSDTLEDEN